MAFSDLVASIDAAVDAHLGDGRDTFAHRRYPVGGYVDGIYQPAAPVISTILSEGWEAAAGADLEALEDAEHGEEVRVITTFDDVRTRSPGVDPDIIVMDGEDWIVIHVDVHRGVDSLPRASQVFVSRQALS